MSEAPTSMPTRRIYKVSGPDERLWYIAASMIAVILFVCFVIVYYERKHSIRGKIMPDEREEEFQRISFNT